MPAAPHASRFRDALGRLEWRRGLRAGTAICAVVAVTALLHRPAGWAALGAYLAIIVDSGGSYRSRLAHVVSFLAGGVVAAACGNAAAGSLAASLLLTAAFCFAVTLSRVLAQPLAGAATSILVCYFVALGNGPLPWHAQAVNDASFLAGGCWSAMLILVLWPVDAVRPARLAAAECFSTLAELARAAAQDASPQGDVARPRVHTLWARMRDALETAQAVLGTSVTRSAARLVRVRNLLVLLGDADLLFARTLHLAELSGSPALRKDVSQWVAAACDTVADALRQRPFGDGAAFAPEGSHSADLRLQANRLQQAIAAGQDPALHDVTQDLLLTLQVAFEAVRALWSGVEPRTTAAAPLRQTLGEAARTAAAARFRASLNDLGDTIRAHWTPDSVMLRHAVRLALVAMTDVLLMRRIHVTHGFWLAMTSIIVLQPYTGSTLRLFTQRVGGTIAGGILAAVLASLLPDQTSVLLAVVVFGSTAAAVYAADYGWYCFFLTPTFVLLGMPHLRDWTFAAVRIGMTLAGASIAVLGVLLLGRRREAVRLPLLLARAAEAEANYVRATGRFLAARNERPGDATARLSPLDTSRERHLLAPARRACGLAAAEAEESLERALHEPALRGRNARAGNLHRASLTITTHLRRLTGQLTALTLTRDVAPSAELAALGARLDRVSQELGGRADGGAAACGPEPGSHEAAAALRRAATGAGPGPFHRLERSVAEVERAARQMTS